MQKHRSNIEFYKLPRKISIMSIKKFFVVGTLVLLVVSGSAASVQAACKPKCLYAGTRSEGWYDSCTRQLIKFANCSGHEAILTQGPAGYGWYDSVTQEYIAPASIPNSGENETPNHEAICVKVGIDTYKCMVIGGDQYICKKGYLECNNSAVKIVYYNGVPYTCAPVGCVIVSQGDRCYVRCSNSWSHVGMCKETEYPGIYKCEYQGDFYYCGINKEVFENCQGTVIIAKYINYKNKTLYCLPPDVVVRIDSTGCYIEPVYQALEPSDNDRLSKCVENVRRWAGSLARGEVRTMCEYLMRLKSEQINPFLKCLAEKYKENVTFPEAVKECREEIRNVTCPEPKIVPPCPGGELVPIIRSGCVVAYRCITPKEEMRRCVLNLTKQGMNRTEAIRECVQRHKEDVINTISNLTEQQLAIYTHCLNISNDTKEKVLSLIKEIRELRKEKLEKIREISENCSRYQGGNETTYRVNYSCGQEISNVTKYYNEKIREVMRKIIDITKNVTISVNTTCLQVKLHRFENLTGIHINTTIQPENLTQAQKKYVIQRMVGKKLVEELRRNPRMIKQVLTHRELKSALFTEIRRNKTLLREVIKNPEVRKEIIKEVATNRTMRRVMLRTILRDKQLRRLAIKELIRNKDIKRELLQNKTLLAEILPPKLKTRLQKLRFVDINVTEQRNNTIYVARVVKTGRLLGLIPITITEDVEFNDTTVIAERKPWWSFLVLG